MHEAKERELRKEERKRDWNVVQEILLYILRRTLVGLVKVERGQQAWKQVNASMFVSSDWPPSAHATWRWAPPTYSA